ncbi:ubiquitin-fold modifier-conjugating enzyme 1 [Cyclospora cayetanensis]|uniref:Ubiquitin-fold modifier-conjugating enzyme 1 n=2 Tax=Cyclospora cayetanensis TaxID=88456 RepID=A0A6P5WDP7_9EIME|nr:ubiquitin-fold modifier-conjugating enzyme 1 [Cyclospora cayetanensis]OEH76054.1 UFM1-conjugating enzyme 1 [Cyclospora cayetanensis]
MADQATRAVVDKLPLCSVNAGPRSPQWNERLKEEYRALISYLTLAKENDKEWFKIEANQEGTEWKGRCWCLHEMVRYEFDLVFDIPATYPLTPIDLRLPELDGKTSKMYRGGRICLDAHFAPLWSKNAPKFGIAHALALGLGPWLAAEVPYLVDSGVLMAS